MWIPVWNCNFITDLEIHIRYATQSWIEVFVFLMLSCLSLFGVVYLVVQHLLQGQ